MQRRRSRSHRHTRTETQPRIKDGFLLDQLGQTPLQLILIAQLAALAADAEKDAILALRRLDDFAEPRALAWGLRAVRIVSLPLRFAPPLVAPPRKDKRESEEGRDDRREHRQPERAVERDPKRALDEKRRRDSPAADSRGPLHNLAEHGGAFCFEHPEHAEHLTVAHQELERDASLVIARASVERLEHDVVPHQTDEPESEREREEDVHRRVRALDAEVAVADVVVLDEVTRAAYRAHIAFAARDSERRLERREAGFVIGARVELRGGGELDHADVEGEREPEVFFDLGE